MVTCRGWVERDYQKPWFGEGWMWVSEDKAGRQRLGRMVYMTISRSLDWFFTGARIARSGKVDQASRRNDNKVRHKKG